MLLMRLIAYEPNYGYGFWLIRLMYSFFLREKTMSIVLRKHSWV